MKTNFEWQRNEYSSSEFLDLGLFKIQIIHRLGSQDRPISENERYEFIINGLISSKKFSTAEDAKRVALSSSLNKLNSASEIIRAALSKVQLTKNN